MKQFLQYFLSNSFQGSIPLYGGIPLPQKQVQTSTLLKIFAFGQLLISNSHCCRPIDAQKAAHNVLAFSLQVDLERQQVQALSVVPPPPMTSKLFVLVNTTTITKPIINVK